MLYDGHRSHVSLTLTNRDRRNNIIIFVLPPHTSPLTQPLDVGIFGPFKSTYNKDCQDYMKHNPGLSITKYEVAKLTAKPYVIAVSAENLTSAFRKTGIFPYNSKAITETQVAPASIYCTETVETNEAIVNDSQSNESPGNTDTQGHINNQVDQLMHDEQQPGVPVIPVPDSQSKQADFFQARTITSVIQPKQKRKFVQPFLAGSLRKKSVMDGHTASSSFKEIKNAFKIS